MLKRNFAITLFVGLTALLFSPISANGGEDNAPVKAVEGAQGNWPARIRIASGPAGGQWDTFGNVLNKIIDKKLRRSSVRIGGGVKNIEDINNKTAELGFSLTMFMSDEKIGDVEFDNLHRDNVQMIGVLYPQVLYAICRDDFARKNKITDFASLLKVDGVKFASLPTGTASEYMLRLLLKYSYQTDIEQLKNERKWIVSMGNYSEIPDKMVSGEFDAFVYSAGRDVPLLHTMETLTPIRFLPIDETATASLREKFKMGIYTLKTEQYQSIKTPTPTLATYTCLLVRRDLPESLASRIAEIIWDGREEITKSIADFYDFSSKVALLAGDSIHPGAKSFWQSINK